MHVSDRMLAVIAQEEGVVLKAYRCPAGVLTVGVGHTSRAGAPKVRAGMTVSREQAFAILRDDLRRVFEPRVNRALPGVAPNVFDGATSFDFNTGRVHNASWVTRFKAGNRAKAEASFKSWNRGGGRVLKGLVRRRQREADIIFRNRYGTGRAVPPPVKEDAEVTSYQAALAKLGYYRGEIDGQAGPKTKAAVEAFQKRNGLTIDGVVGPATRATLSRVLNARTANRTSAAGGVTAAGTDAALNGSQAPQHVVAQPDSFMQAAGPVITLAAIAVAVWVGFWVWRNRGWLFAWLPEPVKDAIQDRAGIVVGRRIAT